MDNKRPTNIARKGKSLANTTYHVTAHGIDDLQVFGHHSEKRAFINCLQRHLTRQRVVDAKRRPYKKHFEHASLLAFCVMDNHFHLVIHQQLQNGMADLMHTVLSGYGKYFNAAHGRKGPLFREPYAAKPILEHQYAKRAIAYVHLNHEEKQLNYEHCSHDYYVGRRHGDWIDSHSALAIFGGLPAYERYIEKFGPDILALKAARRKTTDLGF